MKKTNEIHINGEVGKIVFSPNKKYFGICVSNNEIKLFDSNELKEIGQIRINGNIYDFSISTNGEKIVFIYQNNPIQKENWLNRTSIGIFESPTNSLTKSIQKQRAISVQFVKDDFIMVGFEENLHGRIVKFSDNLAQVGEDFIPVNHDQPWDTRYYPNKNWLISMNVWITIWDLETRSDVWDIDKANLETKKYGADIWECVDFEVTNDLNNILISHWGTDKGKSPKTVYFDLKENKVIDWYFEGTDSMINLSISHDDIFAIGNTMEFIRIIELGSGKVIWEEKKIFDKSEKHYFHPFDSNILRFSKNKIEVFEFK